VRWQNEGSFGYEAVARVWGSQMCLSVRGQFAVSFSSVYVANLGLLRIFLLSLPITDGGTFCAPSQLDGIHPTLKS